MKLIFATNNKHKLDEIRAALAHLPQYEIISLSELGFNEDIPETADTLEGNALQKARFIYDRFGLSCFADDTGLEIEALGGRPGVYSARYAGEGCSFDDNIDKVLIELNGITNRKAEFRTVICLLIDDEEFYFTGDVKGEILTQRSGNKGFGYDPVFKPYGFDFTFAEMELTEKNSISHRGRAVQQLVKWLENVK
ncbi:MAG: non-canonical purine NTP diphosphatase [Bacteroidales bacterium]